MHQMSVNEYLNGLSNDTKCINMTNMDLKVMPDLSRFTQIKELYCSNNQLTTLGVLPETLKILNCDFNQLTTLGVLPKILRLLNCNNNNLTSLGILPETLQILYCSSNNLTTLGVLPKTLIYLRCSNNKLTTLEDLPETLQEIHCSNNKLTTLEDLPKSIRIIYCNNNNISYIPDYYTNKKLYISLDLNDNPNILINYPLFNKYKNILEAYGWHNSMYNNLLLYSIKEKHNDFISPSEYILKRNKEIPLERALALAKGRMDILNENNILVETVVKKTMHPNNIQKYLSLGYSIDSIYEMFDFI